MRRQSIILMTAICLLAGACTVQQPVSAVSPETQTYRAKANAGLLAGGAEAANRSATEEANKHCAAEGKRAQIIGQRAHQVFSRSISEVTFHCVS
jgi:hypothetical protein